jgi:hypothetical protein
MGFDHPQILVSARGLRTSPLRIPVFTKTTVSKLKEDREMLPIA